MEEKKTRFPGLILFGYWFLSLCYLESVVHFTVYDGFHPRFLYAVGLTAAIAAMVTLLFSLVPGTFRFGGMLVTILVLTFLYGSQMVYEFIFGTMYSVAQMGMGGAAMASFWRELLATMGEKFPYIVSLMLPLAALILLRKFRGGMFRATFGKSRILMALAAVVFHVLVLVCLRQGGTGMFSDYGYYYSDTIATNQTAERFGILTMMRLELIGSFGGEAAQEEGYFVAEDPEASVEDDQVEYNVLELDFDALNSKTENEMIRTINDYCAQFTGTNKNEYTGMLADYNLIVLCAESFATGVIDPELTPTLYRLANEGIVFNHYYNAFPNTTTDGEYALVQGLWPDTSRDKGVSSLYNSRNSYLPFTLGNLFKEQRGIQAYGYHNYIGAYYGREESHPNMGYSMKFANDGMTFTDSWPASDLEMMEQSIDDYIGMEQFHAYYMTFSGHYKYDTTNALVRKNWDEAYGLPYSRKTRSYISCNLELEYAMSYLMQRLEEAGVADRTAIVLAGDHFPYGLEDEEYAELVGGEIDCFSKFKSTLIFWVGGLEENIVVDEYCCNVDILPTIANLWGFAYDSRMLAGTDVFSDGTHVAVLVDKSFLTEKVWFDANTGETRYLVPESEIPAGYIENMHRLVNTRFSISSDILNSGYYNFIFDKGEVNVGADSWKGRG
ncbi:MAG: LTA synthase family protein [Faecousia sp.]